MIEMTELVPVSMDEEIYPFYFAPSPEHDLSMPSAMIMIRPDEFGKLKLPPGWGTWDDAVEI